MNLHVHIQRNEITESRHDVNALIMNHEGKTLKAFYADPIEMWTEVFPRSAIKFAQALCFVRSGAVEKFNLRAEHIAIACASHWAENFHTSLVSDWLAIMGETEDALECGSHYPADEETSHNLIKQGLRPTNLHNNCSGKHAGIIAACKALGLESRGYSQYSHPIQLQIRQILSQISDFDFTNGKWGVDGCGIPTYPITLQVMAKMMTALLPQRQNHEYGVEAARIVKSIQQYPRHISGTQGLCSKIIEVTAGRILAKTGAEGVYVALDLKQGLVLVLKARDGQTRASRAALLWIMKEQNWLSDAEYSALKSGGLPVLQNWSGQAVGDTKVIES